MRQSTQIAAERTNSATNKLFDVIKTLNLWVNSVDAPLLNIRPARSLWPGLHALEETWCVVIDPAGHQVSPKVRISSRLRCRLFSENSLYLLTATYC
jgi:hypothetical protein